jgi:Zinc carboxypeptidase/Penicillin-insensitive murein endopeptidase
VRALGTALLALALGLAAAGATAAAPAGESRAVGLPWHGVLVNGVALPAESDSLFTWDFVQRRAPNREWRRTGTQRLVSTLLRVTREYRAAHREAPRIGIGDLSRPGGGDFGDAFGAPGHASHQNGLDADVYYPRTDGRERPPGRPGQIARRLAQDLVDRFVAAGAVKVFVGPHTGLTGPPAIVEVLPRYHDNHLHVRLAGDGVASAELGTSTLGRSIRAFRVGRGHARVLVVGCVHGDECAGSVIATRLLHARPPAEGSIWVVPDLNPDGHAAKRRTNARGVDLNRNFPGSWRDLATSGRAPGSESETRLAMRLIRRLRPDVTIWFHQPQDLVRATGPSVAVARRFARLVRMRFRELPRPPGSATDWQQESLPGTRAFVVELPPGQLGILEAGRWTHAVLELAAD